ncbi:MAG: hypothetical protein K2I23_02125, partial [Clostridia bacterium]|nr:hypothetical protein [Clostridia bacterium]
ALEELLAKLKELPLWQISASAVGIILSLIFFARAASYDSKRRKAKKLTQNKYRTYYAAAFLGMSASSWTVVACVILGLVALSLVTMIISKVRYNKAQEELDMAKDEFEQAQARKKEDDMRMMLMGIMGANAGGNGSMQTAAIDLGAIRGMIDDAMSRNMQQLPEPSMGADNEVVQRLLDENARSQEAIRDLMQKLSEQQPVEKVVAREVAAANANDETIKSLIEGQKTILQQLAELSAKQDAQPQIVEKVVEVPVEVEKIVEKEVRVEVPVEVEKIVEKEVVKEVPVEKIVEVPVEVEVPVAVPTPSKPKKEVAPKLTLDEAYAGLSKQQQKYFDGLREYALTKDKCKEKKSTYFIIFGQSTANPLMKLTIKKDTVVALFKMEDEYMKDIRKDATSDGTKVKVKETEVIISDAQACKVAKNMIDLREDQIERYQDLLKEQRAMSKKK